MWKLIPDLSYYTPHDLSCYTSQDLNYYTSPMTWIIVLCPWPEEYIPPPPPPPQVTVESMCRNVKVDSWSELLYPPWPELLYLPRPELLYFPHDLNYCTLPMTWGIHTLPPPPPPPPPHHHHTHTHTHTHPTHTHYDLSYYIPELLYPPWPELLYGSTKVDCLPCIFSHIVPIHLTFSRHTMPMLWNCAKYLMFDEIAIVKFWYFFSNSKCWCSTYKTVTKGLDGWCVIIRLYLSVNNCGKYLQVWHKSFYWDLQSFQMFYRPFIPNKTTFTTNCLTQWISKLPWSFEIHLGALKST